MGSSGIFSNFFLHTHLCSTQAIGMARLWMCGQIVILHNSNCHGFKWVILVGFFGSRFTLCLACVTCVQDQWLPPPLLSVLSRLHQWISLVQSINYLLNGVKEDFMDVNSDIHCQSSLLTPLNYATSPKFICPYHGLFTSEVLRAWVNLDRFTQLSLLTDIKIFYKKV